PWRDSRLFRPARSTGPARQNGNILGFVDRSRRPEDHSRMDERRSFTRQLTCIPAYFESKADPQDLALIRDVSTSGARLLTRAKLELDESVTLHLYLGGEGDEPRKASGRIVRVD